MIPWVSLNFWMREWRFLLGHECFFPLSTHRGETRKNNGCIERLIIKSDCIIWKILKSYNSINWGWTYYSTTGFFFSTFTLFSTPSCFLDGLSALLCLLQHAKIATSSEQELPFPSVLLQVYTGPCTTQLWWGIWGPDNNMNNNKSKKRSLLGKQCLYRAL